MSQRHQPHTETPISPRHLDDLRLVQDCVRGDRLRWAELFERHERTLFFAILNTLRARGARSDQNLVEDLQADIAVELVKNDFARLRKYSGRCRLSQWLKVVASNFTIDYLRKQRPSVSLSDDAPISAALRNSLRDPAESPLDALEHDQTLDAVRALFDMLPEDDRRFVELFYRKERSFDEIATLMNTSVGAIYARKNRVRKKITALAREHGLLRSGQ